MPFLSCPRFQVSPFGFYLQDMEASLRKACCDGEYNKAVQLLDRGAAVDGVDDVRGKGLGFRV